MKRFKTIPLAIAASALALSLSQLSSASAEDAPAPEAAAPAEAPKAEAAPPSPAGAPAEAAPAEAPAEQAAPAEAPAQASPPEKDVATPAEGKTEKTQLSEAQILLFETPHLKNIGTPSVITYRFERKSQFKDDFKDTVKVKIDKVLPDGAKDVSFEFFTGRQNRPYPALEHFSGNPLVMVYLSRDVTEMARLVGGSTNFYRSKVRYGFMDKATVSEVEVPGPNGPVKGHKIEMKPFVAETDRAYEMGPNLQKTYEFIVSEDVPGGLYSIRTMVPPDPGKEDKGNVIEETLVYENVAASPVADVKP